MQHERRSTTYSPTRSRKSTRQSVEVKNSNQVIIKQRQKRSLRKYPIEYDKSVMKREKAGTILEIAHWPSIIL